jgi:CheY-like chemotaxis protein
VLLSPREKKPTVLIVEDDHTLRELYRVTLMGAGYAVVAVEDGIDALRYIEGQVPNLVLLDLELPRLDGRDVQRELAAHPETSGIPIVVVTGTDTCNLRASDFCALLKKPVSTDSLLVTIEAALRAGHISQSMARGARPDVHPRTHRTVLIVDDDVAMQRLLTNFLEARGYGVKAAGSVGEAILALEHSIIDAVILDVRMPRRSGLDLLEFIRLDRKRRNFPVLVLTGATLTSTEEAMIARDCGDLFYKSGNFEPLGERLDHLTR